MFHVYTADLNSLYDDRPRPAVFVGRTDDEEEAKEAVANLQTHDTAAWYRPARLH